MSEKANGLINYEFLDEKNPSASRTLLRLHRALKMVALLLQKISSDKKEKMSKIAYDSYHECPMPAHHPWVIKKGSLSIYDQLKSANLQMIHILDEFVKIQESTLVIIFVIFAQK